jgi:two-component sensor histidine kinase
MLLNVVRLTTNELSKLVAVLSSAAIVCGLAIWSWSDFVDARRDAEAKVSAAVVAISDVMHWSLVALRGVVEPIAAKIEAGSPDEPFSEKELEDLRRFAQHLPDVGELFVTDREGNVVAAEPKNLPFSLNLSDREWFKALKDGTSGVYIGRAVKGRVFRDLIFPVAISIRRPDGTFLGAVEIRVGMAYLAHLSSSQGVGRGATVGIYRATDGAVVGRYPMTETLLDESIATLPYFSTLTKSDAQSWLGWLQNGGEAHLVAARRLHNWPLIVSISLTKREIYSNEWRLLLWRSVAAALLLAGLLALTALGTRQAWREATLMGELEHRAKNLFSAVLVVVDRAHEGSQSINDVLSSLRGRIQSMAHTQTLLGRSRGKGASLGDLVRGELKPYATGTNTAVEGRAVHLSPEASHAVGMVIHELTTNAAKHGALSRSGGQVSVRWTLTADQGRASMLRIEWNEMGGPPNSAPTRQGYGSEVIQDLLTFEFGGKVDVVFADAGFRCTIELPANAGTIV